jgi:hypothetical protein
MDAQRKIIIEQSDKQAKQQLADSRKTAINAGYANTALNIADAFTLGKSKTIQDMKEKARQQYMDSLGIKDSGWWSAGDFAGKVGGQALFTAATMPLSALAAGKTLAWGGKALSYIPKAQKIAQGISNYGNAMSKITNVNFGSGWQGVKNLADFATRRIG